MPFEKAAGTIEGKLVGKQGVVKTPDLTNEGRIATSIIIYASIIILRGDKVTTEVA